MTELKFLCSGIAHPIIANAASATAVCTIFCQFRKEATQSSKFLNNFTEGRHTRDFASLPYKIAADWLLIYFFAIVVMSLWA